MIVSELINFLQKQPPDALVVITAFDGGVNECITSIGVKVQLNANYTNWRPGMGIHEISYHQIKHLADDEVSGVLLQ